MIKGHEIAVLQFSGGKDSLACLWLLEEHWDDLIVMWVDTGDSAPEVAELVASVGQLVKQLIVVRSNQPEQNLLYGPPVDLLPVWDTEFGRKCDQTRRGYFQTPFACCSENIWAPMAEATKATGATLIIRGQRKAEAKKSPISSGHIEDGVEYWFPIEDWSAVSVTAFLDNCGQAMPVNYRYFDSSPDCLTCTAYLDENRGKADWLLKFHPAAADTLRKRMMKIHNSCIKELSLQRDLLGELNA